MRFNFLKCIFQFGSRHRHGVKQALPRKLDVVNVCVTVMTGDNSLFLSTADRGRERQPPSIESDIVFPGSIRHPPPSSQQLIQLVIVRTRVQAIRPGPLPIGRLVIAHAAKVGHCQSERPTFLKQQGVRGDRSYSEMSNFGTEKISARHAGQLPVGALPRDCKRSDSPHLRVDLCERAQRHKSAGTASPKSPQGHRRGGLARRYAFVRRALKLCASERTTHARSELDAWLRAENSF